jgi:SAM-dependent methyltransferase
MTAPTQSEYWNSDAGARWVRQQPIMDALLRAHGERALDAAELAAGATVLDVGCGCGATTLSVAERVGPRGLAVGVDISAPMLSLAKQRAADAGLANVHFELGDVQAHPLEDRRFDAVVSRFGIMFFPEPATAFGRIRRALRDGGRFAAVCWRDPSENPWITLPIAATSAFLTTEPIDVDVPGPFSLSPRERTRGVLEGAGFQSVQIEPLDLPLTLGQTPEVAASVVVGLGPVGRVMLAASDEQRRRAIQAVAERLGPHTTGAGVVMPSAAWLLTARGG